MSFGPRRTQTKGAWAPFYAAIILRNDKELRELRAKVAALEARERPLEQEAWVETSEGPRRMIVSFLSPDEKVRLGFRGLFG